MKDFMCSATIEGDKYELLTMGAVTQSQAFQQFEKFCLEHGGHLELATEYKCVKVTTDD